jgi:hypothetical protein
MRRAVFLMGTFDVINSQACAGGAGGWDGNAGSAGDPLLYYGAEIQKAEELFPGVSLVVSTIPPLGAPYASTGCTAVLNTLNTRIRSMAAAYEITVADFYAAVPASDIMASGAYAGIAPNAEGYAAMARAYDEINR